MSWCRAGASTHGGACLTQPVLGSSIVVVAFDKELSAHIVWLLHALPTHRPNWENSSKLEGDIVPTQSKDKTTDINASSGAWRTHIADPGPLGLGAFAMTTFVLSVFNTNLVTGAATAVVFGMAFFYGGLAQMLAGMWEFVKGNTFGAVAFTSYGAFWLSFWYLNTHIVNDLGGADAAGSLGASLDHAVGVYLLGWAIFTAYMLIAALRTNGVLIAVFAALTLAFVFLALGKFFPTATSLTTIGGVIGIITAVFAWYGSFAAVINSTFKRTVLPVFARD